MIFDIVAIGPMLRETAKISKKFKLENFKNYAQFL